MTHRDTLIVASYWKRRSSKTRHLLGRLIELESAQAGPNETCLVGAPTPPVDLLRELCLSRLASGALIAASSVPWRRGPSGDGRSSCSRDPRRGGQPPSSATFPGGRDWEKHLLETAAPWNTGRVGRPISWGHWGETGTVWDSVYTALS